MFSEDEEGTSFSLLKNWSINRSSKRSRRKKWFYARSSCIQSRWMALVMSHRHNSQEKENTNITYAAAWLIFSCDGLRSASIFMYVCKAVVVPFCCVLCRVPEFEHGFILNSQRFPLRLLEQMRVPSSFHRRELLCSISSPSSSSRQVFLEA